MQRRLILALVGIALASVLLVGAGVLVLAQIGAGEAAEAEVAAQLDALSELLGTEVSLTRIDRARTALDLDELALVAVDQTGSARHVALPLGRPLPYGVPSAVTIAGPATSEPVIPQMLLEGDRFDRFLAGETVITSQTGAGTTVVRGVRRIDLPAPGSAVGGPETVAGLLATRSVVAVSTETRVWFAVSAVSVLAASLMAAWFLAHQLTKPLQQIQRATSSIAAGDFGVRVNEGGTDELAELSQAVNRMARELERSRELDQQFLMSVSHDLRTPLAAITGYAEALSDRAVHDTVRTGDVILNHASRLERLVGDLLDLARLDARRFQFHWQTLDAGVVVGRAVAGLEREADRRGLRLQFDNRGPLLVQVDADRLSQIIGNVLDNALRYARSEIVTSVRARGTHALVEISDDGPGISPRDLPHVFERLYIAPFEPVRSETSCGLGLAIVRELTVAMGGTVAAGYRPGGGARITLRLPLADCETGAIDS